jgi:voltage-gated potassium channel
MKSDTPGYHEHHSSKTASQRLQTYLLAKVDTFKELYTYLALLTVLAAIAYSYFEGKGIMESLWWATVTLFTVGYGDMYPQTAGGRVVAILLMAITLLLIIPLITTLLTKRAVVDNDAFKHSEQEQLKRDAAQAREDAGAAKRAAEATNAKLDAILARRKR